MTLPIQHSSDLMTSIVTRERLLVCMRCDDPLAEHEAVPTHLLNHRISLLQYPKVHPVAHARMLELLRAVSITPKPNNPTNNREHIQWMIQEKQCLAFFREGTRLLPGLTLRPVHGADWTIDTALILKPTSQHPALALLLRELRKGSGCFGSGYVARRPATVQVTMKRREPQQSKAKQHSINGSLFESHG